MTLQQKPSIEDFFDFKNRNSDGSLSIYQWSEDSKDRLYIVNQHQKKLLQFIIKNEREKNEQITFAQIKIIPYGIKHAKIYRDQLNDPNLMRIYSGIDLTYHGGPKGDQTPKNSFKNNRSFKKSLSNIGGLWLVFEQ